MKRMRYVTAVVVALVALVAAKPAYAQVGGCLPDVGKRVPVLLVHGFWGDEGLWTSSSFDAFLGRNSDLRLDTFGYKKFNSQWVDHKEIGPALADRIACMAQSSRGQGGKGKVVVVAHSMGGLATRFAAAQTINGRKVSDDLGLVMTIATPNTGSDFARDGLSMALGICAGGGPFASGFGCGALGGVSLLSPAVLGMATGSPQLAALPGWPAGVPVRALAGNITSHVGLGFARVTVVNNHDTLVPTSSALQGQMVNGLGGTREFACNSGRPAWPWVSDAPCEHTALLRNPDVQQDVAGTIQQYVAQLDAPPPTTKPQARSGQTCGQIAVEGTTTYPVAAVGLDCAATMQFAQAFADHGKETPENAALRRKYPCKYKPEVTHRAVCSDGKATITIG